MLLTISYKINSKDKLKEIDIKNYACYYFDDKMRVIHIDFYNILPDKKSYKKLLIYNIWF